MNNFKVKGLQAIQKKLRLSGKMLEEKAIDVIVDEVIKTYKVTLAATPQYSGYLASNLRIFVNGQSAPVANELYADHQNWSKLSNVKQKGDPAAMEIASSYNRGFFNSARPGLTMQSTVGVGYLSGYWRPVEAGVNLRDVNGSGKALAKGFGRLNRIYSFQLLMKSGTESI